MSGKKLLLISLIVIVVLAIPLTIYLVQRQQNTQSQATASTTLAFDPTSIQKNIDDEFTFDINIDPGNNLVSFISLEILYDATKLEPVGGASAFVVDPSSPLRIVQSLENEGTIRVSLSVGADPTAAIADPRKIATLKMKALDATGTTPTELKFGTQTVVNSIAGPVSGSGSGSDDSADENVLSSTTPALITIQGSAVPTAIPTVPNPTPTGGSDPIPTATPTLVPTSPPVSTSTPTPTSGQTVLNPTATPTSTLLAQGPTSTPTSGSVNANSNFTTGTPTPSIGAVGPGSTFLGFGMIVALLTIVGSLLFFTL